MNNSVNNKCPNCASGTLDAEPITDVQRIGGIDREGKKIWVPAPDIDARCPSCGYVHFVSPAIIKSPCVMIGKKIYA